jgi:RNA polymerase sigma factor (sigma-70 family)
MVWLGLDLRWAYADLLPGIYRQTHCTHLAQDILHDAFVRFAFIRDRHKIDQPHAYLRTVVRNVLTDKYREMSRFVPIATEGHDQDDIPLTEDQITPSPEKLADIQQRLQALQNIIDCLPPRCREVFWLYRIDGLAQTEVASRLNISLNMVERHIMRALVDLRAARDLMI